eukprot:7608827-Pyramimonas_sp.AAC.1
MGEEGISAPKPASIVSRTDLLPMRILFAAGSAPSGGGGDEPPPSVAAPSATGTGAKSSELAATMLVSAESDMGEGPVQLVALSGVWADFFFFWGLNIASILATSVACLRFLALVRITFFVKHELSG